MSLENMLSMVLQPASDKTKAVQARRVAEGRSDRIERRDVTLEISGEQRRRVKPAQPRIRPEAQASPASIKAWPTL
ncbi:hypothetical protein, partial [Klebsiella pneumoniae]|uniref:hypothetical protein n=1 Tax=Klebsiella pneumoniae TaxID=573 RepID=UPI0039C0C58E